MTDGVSFVSLFSGCGALDLGLEKAGLRCTFQCEFNPHARAVLRYRSPEVNIWPDIQTLTGTTLPFAPVWAFGSPCQGFSRANKRNGNGIDHPASKLVREVSRLLREVPPTERPDLLLWENVADVFARKHAAGVARWLGELRELGYEHGRAHFLTGWDGGVPQTRKRALTIISRLGPVPEPTCSWNSDVPLLSSVLDYEAAGWIPEERRKSLLVACTKFWMRRHKVDERGLAESMRVVEQYRKVLLDLDMPQVATFSRVWSRNPCAERVSALVCGRECYVGIPGKGLRLLTSEEREILMGLPPGWTHRGLSENGVEYDIPEEARAQMTGNAVVVGVGKVAGLVINDVLRSLSVGKSRGAAERWGAEAPT